MFMLVTIFKGDPPPKLPSISRLFCTVDVPVPPTYKRPPTLKVLEGEVVAIPRFPSLSIYNLLVSALFLMLRRGPCPASLKSRCVSVDEPIIVMRGDVEEAFCLMVEEKACAPVVVELPETSKLLLISSCETVEAANVVVAVTVNWSPMVKSPDKDRSPPMVAPPTVERELAVMPPLTVIPLLKVDSALTVRVGVILSLVLPIDMFCLTEREPPTLPLPETFSVLRRACPATWMPDEGM